MWIIGEKRWRKARDTTQKLHYACRLKNWKIKHSKNIAFCWPTPTYWLLTDLLPQLELNLDWGKLKLKKKYYIVKNKTLWDDNFGACALGCKISAHISVKYLHYILYITQNICVDTKYLCYFAHFCVFFRWWKCSVILQAWGVCQQRSR